MTPEPPRAGTAWSGMDSMRAVHNVDLGRNWRGDEAAARRHPGQRWGLPAALSVLGLHLVAAVLAAVWAARADTPIVVFALIVPSALAGIAAVLVSVVRGNGPVVDFGLPRTAQELFAQVRSGLICGSAAVVGGLALAAILLTVLPGEQESPLVGMVSIPPGWLAVLLLWILLGAPITEELMFRGLLWGAMERQGHKPQAAHRRLLRFVGHQWTICLVTAVLFALWHMEWWRLPILIYAGVMLGIARMRTGSVLASAVAHSLNNLLPALALLALASGG